MLRTTNTQQGIGDKRAMSDIERATSDKQTRQGTTAVAVETWLREKRFQRAHNDEHQDRSTTDQRRMASDEGTSSGGRKDKQIIWKEFKLSQSFFDLKNNNFW